MISKLLEEPILVLDEKTNRYYAIFQELRANEKAAYGLFKAINKNGDLCMFHEKAINERFKKVGTLHKALISSLATIYA